MITRQADAVANGGGLPRIGSQDSVEALRGSLNAALSYVQSYAAPT